MGRTVRDGFLSAFYEQGGQSIAVQLYDTGGTPEKTRIAYESAMAKGATLIVGPLTKVELQALVATKPTLPILALNTLSSRPVSQLYQFALLPEDEITSIANFAWMQGYRRIVIVASANERGKRLAKYFKEQWEKKGGKILKTESITKNNKTQERLESIASAYAELEEGSEQLPDAFFLATSADIARQIKPLLDFHYRPNTPVLATANVYTGVPMPLKDQDLGGIVFCDMPWILEESGTIAEKRHQAQRVWSNSDKEAPRLFALGMDAFAIATQWSTFVGNKNVTLQGMSGQLQVDKQTQQVRRRLSCSRFVDGQPKTVGIPDSF
jgi:outer membrane PBP1 activator LpoA protein